MPRIKLIDQVGLQEHLARCNTVATKYQITLVPELQCLGYVEAKETHAEVWTIPKFNNSTHGVLFWPKRFFKIIKTKCTPIYNCSVVCNEPACEYYWAHDVHGEQDTPTITVSGPELQQLRDSTAPGPSDNFKEQMDAPDIHNHVGEELKVGEVLPSEFWYVNQKGSLNFASRSTLGGITTHDGRVRRFHYIGEVPMPPKETPKHRDGDVCACAVNYGNGDTDEELLVWSDEKGCFRSYNAVNPFYFDDTPGMTVNVIKKVGNFYD